MSLGREAVSPDMNLHRDCQFMRSSVKGENAGDLNRRVA